ncbi:MAG: dihydropteroate synthase, partial [Gammaproteobacteria bacterium]
GIPLMLGVSRKSTIGRVLQRSIKKRLAGGLALVVLAVKQGVKLIRTHDVKETVDVIKMTTAVLST